jgi:two-component system sporulation sensor kinase A
MTSEELFMKKIGQISFISIAIIFVLIEVLLLGEPLKRQIIDLFILVTLAWFVGRQYDKVKFYGERIKASEENKSK